VSFGTPDNPKESIIGGHLSCPPGRSFWVCMCESPLLRGAKEVVKTNFGKTAAAILADRGFELDGLGDSFVV
jgi:hypothetical protein